MTGLLKPGKGQVYFEGEVVSEVRLPEIRKQLGYVIQDGGYFPHLTAHGQAPAALGPDRFPFALHF